MNRIFLIYNKFFPNIPNLYLIYSLKRLDVYFILEELVENYIENIKNLIYLNANQKIIENYELLVKLKIDIEKNLYENSNN